MEPYPTQQRWTAMPNYRRAPPPLPPQIESGPSINLPSPSIHDLRRSLQGEFRDPWMAVTGDADQLLARLTKLERQLTQLEVDLERRFQAIEALQAAQAQLIGLLVHQIQTAQADHIADYLSIATTIVQMITAAQTEATALRLQYQLRLIEIKDFGRSSPVGQSTGLQSDTPEEAANVHCTREESAVTMEHSTLSQQTIRPTTPLRSTFPDHGMRHRLMGHLTMSNRSPVAQNLTIILASIYSFICITYVRNPFTNYRCPLSPISLLSFFAIVLSLSFTSNYLHSHPNFVFGFSLCIFITALSLSFTSNYLHSFYQRHLHYLHRQL
jgi:hypothetical protein